MLHKGPGEMRSARPTRDSICCCAKPRARYESVARKRTGCSPRLCSTNNEKTTVMIAASVEVNQPLRGLVEDATGRQRINC